MLTENLDIKHYAIQEDVPIVKVIYEPSAGRRAYTAYSADERPWTVPYQRNALFSESWHLIDHLHHVFRTKFWDGQTQALSSQPPPAYPLYTHIRGRHGSGKTQHAIEYAY